MSRLTSLCRLARLSQVRSFSAAVAEAIPEPQSTLETKTYPAHITQIVDAIAGLTLVDVADLNKALKVCFVMVILHWSTGTSEPSRCTNDANGWNGDDAVGRWCRKCRG